jgi:hypothetical protein
MSRNRCRQVRAGAHAAGLRQTRQRSAEQIAVQSFDPVGGLCSGPLQKLT